MPRLYLRRLLLPLGTVLCLLIIWKLSSMTPRQTVVFKPPDELLPKKVDWIDPHWMEMENNRSGPGEHGAPVQTDPSENTQMQELLNVNGFNALVSDKIPLNRSAKDLRHERCKGMLYDRRLPTASVIIPFHDEHWTTLLRTVHSLVNRAPSVLLKEVILVDDNSTKVFLRKPLDQYVADNFKNVRIIRTVKREGLIRARLYGARAAEADVIIFIDSHCEAGYNWLPPLLQPIKDNRKTVTCPFIDVISDQHFGMTPQDEGARGSFDWNLDYKRLPRLPEDATHPELPFDSPIMAGGLFAIDKAWFWTLGGYDPGLDVWGGEQYELSFKVWMCGGRMIDIPCSRIGHVYRRFNPFGVPGIGDYVTRNYKRVAEVWMDDWKKYVYDKHPEQFYAMDAGDLTGQKQLRRHLNCSTFDWFMKTVAFDQPQYYPAVEPVALAEGHITSEQDKSLCLDTKFGHQGDSLKMQKCLSPDTKEENGEQNFEFTWRMEIKISGRPLCLDFTGTGRVVIIYECHWQRGNQYWKYNPATHQIFHVGSNKCLDSKPLRKEVFMDECSNSTTQKWTLENLNEKVAKETWNASNH